MEVAFSCSGWDKNSGVLKGDKTDPVYYGPIRFIHVAVELHIKNFLQSLELMKTLKRTDLIC